MSAKTIARTGEVSFIRRDAHFAIWEEGPARQPDVGQWEVMRAFERQFKNDVFKRIVQTLNRLGWTVGPQAYIFTNDNNRHCVKGDLQADLQLSGRSIKLEFFQGVNCPARPDNGGRYESDKWGCMTYLMRLEVLRTVKRITTYLCNVFDGYTTKPEKLGMGDGMAFILQQRDSLDGFQRCDMWEKVERYNAECKNGLLTVGAPVYLLDKTWGDYGRMLTGIAYPNINNMWWVLLPSGRVRNVASFSLRLVDGTARKGRVIPPELARKRMEKAKAAAIEAENFERAAAVRDAIRLTEECAA